MHRQRTNLICSSFITATILIASVPARTESASQLRDRLASCPHQIVYETYRDNNWELFRINADGSDPFNLTRTSDRHELYPRVSPDGNRLCFVADEMAGGKAVRCVYLMNIDGTGRVKVADNARQPCWSPDGKTIAYLKGKYDQFSVLDYVTKGISFYDVESGNHRQHPNESIEHLYNICWSKNGRWIVTTVHGGMGFSHGILAIEVDGDRVIDLKIGGCRPDLSPDGQHIVWGKTDNIISVGDIDFESDTPTITNMRDIVSDELHVYHADWSPDGKYISFSRGPGGRVQADGPATSRGLSEFVGVRADWNICVIPAFDGGDWVAVTDDGMSNKESDWLIQPGKGGN